MSAHDEQTWAIDEDGTRQFVLAYIEAALTHGKGPLTFVKMDGGKIAFWLNSAIPGGPHGTGTTVEDAVINCAYRGLTEPSE